MVHNQKNLQITWLESKQLFLHGCKPEIANITVDKHILTESFILLYSIMDHIVLN